MDESRLKFIRETQPSLDERDWKERLLRPEGGSTLGLDVSYLGGQCVADIVSGHVSDNALDPQVIEAYHLQYPDLSQHLSFVEEVHKLAGDPDRLRGFFGGIKGKFFELEYRDYLNDGHLPAGYFAELSEKANEPGVDIQILDPHGHVHEQLQAKAYETLQGVREHLERYPEITPVIIPSDQVDIAHAEGLGHLVDGAPISEHSLNQGVHHAIDQASSQASIHLPWVGFSLMGMEVAYLMWKGKPVSFEKMVKRGTKMTVSAFMGQMALYLTHSTWVGIPVSITTRVLLDRYSDEKDLIQVLNEKRKWATNWLGANTTV